MTKSYEHSYKQVDNFIIELKLHLLIHKLLLFKSIFENDVNELPLI